MYYLDSSAILKLLLIEAESAALRSFLTPGSSWTTSEIGYPEVVRAAARHGIADRAIEMLGRATLLHVDRALLEQAAMLPPPNLRTLDAIHVASALLLRTDLDALITYDSRMRAAAEYHGIHVEAPGA